MKQVFRTPVPIELLFSLLRKHCVQTPTHFVFDLNAFRKIQYYTEEREAFLRELETYYHASKRFYVTRKLTYNSMINLLRQICKVNGVAYESHLCYNHSRYTIVYHIAKADPDADDPPSCVNQ